MILSASRRTDIAALYAEWFGRRLEAGDCLVPNPMNARQVARVSLRREDVEAIVFWTRHPRPLFPVLPRLHALGHRIAFQYTITGYGPPVELRNPPVAVAVETFRALAARVPPGTVVWRYDPILLGPAFPPRWHLEHFTRLAAALEGSTERVVVSLLDVYRKTERRLGRLLRWEADVHRDVRNDPAARELLAGLAREAADHGMAIEACAEECDYRALGIGPTRCVDDRLLRRVYGGDWPTRKDPHQRPACGCVVSKDIGVPETCTLGCAYCYATGDDDRARRRRADHDPLGQALVSIGAPGAASGAPAPQNGAAP